MRKAADVGLRRRIGLLRGMQAITELRCGVNLDVHPLRSGPRADEQGASVLGSLPRCTRDEARHGGSMIRFIYNHGQRIWSLACVILLLVLLRLDSRVNGQ